MAPASAPLSINLAEPFEHLSHAPISEAVFQITGRVPSAWDEKPILENLKSHLPDYPVHQSLRSIQQQLNLAPDQPPTQSVDLGWTGAVFQNPTGTQFANFHRDSFSFSRLAPYENWKNFSAEAIRLYAFHLEQSQLPLVQRIGLRFINQFDTPAGDFNIGDYFTHSLSLPQQELPLTRALFFHQDTFMVPGHDYGVTITRTLQPEMPTPAGPAAPKLILDIDVFTTEPSPADPVQIRARLEEMRWLKNKMFFGSLTPATIESFR
jgi:uncharacterized protein (TIGR04255 family)